jgi:hypothetical protein
VFCKAIAQGFFRAKKSTPDQVVVGLQDDSRRREKSREPIRTSVARKLPSHDQFELGAFAMQNAIEIISKGDGCGVALVVSRAFRRRIELDSASTDRVLSFRVSFATIADRSKIGRFLSVLQGYSPGFFSSEKVDPRPSRRRFARR